MRLVKLANNHYRLETGIRTFEADFIKVRRHMESDAGVEGSEIELALLEMKSNRHDTAYFGINGTFLHTGNSGAERKAIAELNAIRQVRAEFLQASQRGSPMELDQAGKRLMSLYISLDVENVMEVLGDVRISVLKKRVA